MDGSAVESGIHIPKNQDNAVQVQAQGGAVDVSVGEPEGVPA